MQTTYRLKTKDISMTFLKSLKTLFAGQEIEITVKSVDTKGSELSHNQNKLTEMIRENRQNAPFIAPDVDIRSLIDNAQYPAR